MTVSSIIPINNYKGNNSVKTFDFDFLIENEEELTVTHIDNKGLAKVLKNGTDYVIKEVGNKYGSYITFPADSSEYEILKDDEVLSLSLTLPIQQESKFENSSNLDLSILEWTFDYIVRILQIMDRKISRSVKVQEGASQTADDLINALQDAQTHAAAAANSAAAAAENAKKSELKSKQSEDNAEELLSDIQEEYEDILEDIKEKNDKALSDIQSAKDLAEREIKDLGAIKPDNKTIFTTPDGTLSVKGLNNPYTLFDNKYSETPLYNASWLLSNGSYYSKSVYVTAYEALEVEQNTELETGLTHQLSSGTGYVKRGLSVKLSTEEFTDYDFVLNKEDESFRLPLLNGSEMLPSENMINISLQNSPTQMDTSYNCYLYLGVLNATEVYLKITKENQLIYDSHITSGNKGNKGTVIFVPRNSHIEITYIGDFHSCRLIKAQGNGNLYYYAGETVQNANLIEAGRILEELNNKVDMKQAAHAGFPSDKHIELALGATGSSYIAPADGYYYADVVAGNSNAYFNFHNIKKGYSECFVTSVPTNHTRCMCRVGKGDEINIEYSNTGQKIIFRFIYAEGAK